MIIPLRRHPLLPDPAALPSFFDQPMVGPMDNSQQEMPPIEKPNKVKIDVKFDKVRDAINERLEEYDNKLDIIRQKVVQYKQQGNTLEANRCMNTYRQTSIYRHKTVELLDKLEQFQFMIDEAFTKMELYETVGEVMGEVSKINVSPEVKGMLKDLKNFEGEFVNQFNKLDQMFGVVTDSINNVDTSTKTQIDTELQAQIDREMKQFEEDTTNQAQEMNVTSW